MTGLEIILKKKKGKTKIPRSGQWKKAWELAALKPRILPWKRSKHWIPIMWSWSWDSPVVYFVLWVVCWMEESFSWMCPSALCVHDACLRHSSSVFSSTVFCSFENKGKTEASCKAQNQMVKLKSIDLFRDKAVVLSWNLLHMLL